MSLYFPKPDEFTRKTIFPGVHIATCFVEKMMLSYVELEPHSVVEEHQHPHEQVGMVVSGEATFYIGNEHQTVGPGGMYRIPGNVRHKVVAGAAPVRVLDIFSPIRDDYR